MGLKGSTGCEASVRRRKPTVGCLLGDKHNGIRQMFKIIENARMIVGAKAIATLPPRTRTRWSTRRPGARQRPSPGRGQDLAAGDDHPPPGRTPDAHAAEVARGGHADADPLHRDPQDEVKIAEARGERDEVATR